MGISIPPAPQGPLSIHTFQIEIPRQLSCRQSDECLKTTWIPITPILQTSNQHGMQIFDLVQCWQQLKLFESNPNSLWVQMISHQQPTMLSWVDQQSTPLPIRCQTDAEDIRIVCLSNKMCDIVVPVLRLERTNTRPQFSFNEKKGN
jgi:hypothetical protein